MNFALYPVEEHFCSFADYGTILATVKRFAAKRVLEFGPGHSTLALIEGGATKIDACEDDPHWFAIYCSRIEDRFPDIVTMRPYHWSEVPTIVGVDSERYDLGLIDGPRDVVNRGAVLSYALARCARVLVALEDDGGSQVMREEVATRAFGLPVEFIQSGPLAGSYAIVGPT